MKTYVSWLLKNAKWNVHIHTSLLVRGVKTFGPEFGMNLERVASLVDTSKLYYFVGFWTVYGYIESESEVAQSCPTLCDPVNCSPSGSSVHGILQARILDWVAISFSRGSCGLRTDQLTTTKIPLKWHILERLLKRKEKYAHSKVFLYSNYLLLKIVLIVNRLSLQAQPRKATLNI